MKLNCKPGQLAIVVGGPSELGNLGKIVRVLRLLAPHDRIHSVCGRHTAGALEGHQAWETDTVLCLGVEFGGRRVFVPVAADEDLRPIGDPGEDEQDESLSWLPSPTKTPETV